MSAHRFVFLFAVFAALAVLTFPTLGCATTNPALHPLPGGKALRVESDANAVAKMESKRPNDETSGLLTFSIGGDMGRETQPRTFQLLHGDKEIDEQDFYEVAGDTDAARQVKEYRDDQMFLQYLGYYGAQFPGGMSVLVGAFGCVFTGVSLVIFPPFALFGAVFTGVASLMAVTFEVLGLSLGNVARGNLSRRSYVLPLARAQAAAAAYNAKNGLSPTPTPSPSTTTAPQAAVPDVAEVQPPSTTVEIDDSTGCVNAEALKRDLEALGSGRVRARIRVEQAAGGVRKVNLSLFSGRVGASSVTRDFEIAESECNDIPRMVSRIARAQFGEAP